MNKDNSFIAQQIRAQYVTKESTELDELKALDKKVKRPANVFAYVFGTIGALILGSGMSLVMTDISDAIGISNPMLWGIIIGSVGLLIAIVNYPVYKGILNNRKKKFADEIISMSNKIMTNE